MIKKIIIFIIDILKQRKNSNHINEDSSYQIFRILNRLSNGLLTKIIELIIVKKNVRELSESYISLEKLPEKETLDLVQCISEMRVYNKTEIKNNKNLDENKFSFKFIQINNNIIRQDVLKTDLLSNLKISQYATNEKWINLIKKELKFNPKLIDITAWYTCEDKNLDYEFNTKYDAQIWHRDVDKLRDIKIFTYLTDVNNIEDGPFEILNNSEDFSLVNYKYFNKNNYRIYDKDISERIKKKKISFLGKKGTTFLVNTRCLHRGARVSKNYRLILELYFSTSLFGKHKNFNNFDKPKLNKNWQSYNLWKEKIEKFPDNYNYLFQGKN